MSKFKEFLNFTGVAGESFYILARNIVYFYGTQQEGTTIAVLAGEKTTSIRVTEKPSEVAKKLSNFNCSCGNFNQNDGMFHYYSSSSTTTEE